VRLVDHHQGIGRQEVHQGIRLLAGPPAGEVTRVVLDPGAAARLAHHLHVEHRPLPQALGLEQFALALEPGHAFLQLFSYAVERPDELLPGCHIVRGRENLQRLDLANDLAGQGVELDDPFDLIAVELDPGCDLVIGRLDVDGVAAHPKA
jgi:hypothetical protein